MAAVARQNAACATGSNPTSLIFDFSRTCRPMLLPPQYFHRDFRRPWMQMLTPPQSLQSDF